MHKQIIFVVFLYVFFVLISNRKLPPSAPIDRRRPLERNKTPLQAENRPLERNKTSLQAENRPLERNKTSLQTEHRPSERNKTSLQTEHRPSERNKTSEATAILQNNIVIVIPFRDRANHYKKIMEHLPSITRENWRIHTILVEQFDNKPFKRAWLMNIGISEAKKRFKDDKTCVVTHDVDMLADSKVDYGWCDRPTQICSELSCYNGGVPYPTSGGGVVQASLKDWFTINGFTNEAIGWGGEDDDLHHRFRLNKLLTGGHLRRPAKGFGKCHCMNDKDHTKRARDSRGYKDIVAKIGRMKRGSSEWKTDGLNSLKYHVSEESVDKYGTIHLKVKDVKTIINEKVVSGTVTHRCKTKPSGKKWDTFKSMINALNQLSTNYTISSGTVLAWYRDCSLKKSDDIDININLRWFSKHQKRLEKSLLASGWKKQRVFGTLGDVGYEEAWTRNKIKTDLFSVAYVDGRYINGLTVNDKVFPCDSFFKSYETHVWNNVKFQVPSPIEPYLRGKYGNWKVEHVANYKWNLEPFKTADGRRHCVHDTNEMERLQANYKERLCKELIINARIQVPTYQIPLIKWTAAEWGKASIEQKKQWKLLNCIDALSLYKPIVLTENDKLPAKVSKYALSPSQLSNMAILVSTLLGRFNRNKIRFFPAFGTLLSTVRNGVMLLPWDDDVDFLVSGENFKSLMTKGLKRLTSSHHCATGQWGCKHYDLGNGVTLTYKEKGMPWKVSMRNTHYPCIDINTYDLVGDRVITPAWQLINGHLHEFNKPQSWIGTLSKTLEAKLFFGSKQTFTLPFPDKAEKIVTSDYGSDAMKRCKTSYNHKDFCHGKNCENAMANHNTKIEFPCSLLN